MKRYSPHLDDIGGRDELAAADAIRELEDHLGPLLYVRRREALLHVLLRDPVRYQLPEQDRVVFRVLIRASDQTLRKHAYTSSEQIHTKVSLEEIKNEIIK